MQLLTILALPAVALALWIPSAPAIPNDPSIGVPSAPLLNIPEPPSAPSLNTPEPPSAPSPIIWDKRSSLQARWTFGLDPTCVKNCVDGQTCVVNDYTTLKALADCPSQVWSCASHCFSWSG